MYFKKVFLLLLAAVLWFQSTAQKLTTSGKEFYVSFCGLSNTLTPGAQSLLFLTSTVNTSGTISNPNTGFNIPFTITAGSVTQVEIPLSEANNDASLADGPGTKGLVVVAKDTVSLYAFTGEPTSSDAASIIQKDALGTDYLVTSFVPTTLSYFIIVGTEDNTKIRITPTANTLNSNGLTGNLAGIPFTITLNKAETFYVISEHDLSGSRVTVTEGCKKIAVFSGAEVARVPSGGSDEGDIFYENLFPVNAHGKEFISFSLKDRNTNFVRVYATYDNTNVTVDGVQAATLNAGQFFEFRSIANEPKYIKTDKPAQVAEFAASFNFDNNNGPDNDAGPTMISIAPVEQQLKRSVFLSPGHGVIVNHKVSIICKTADISGTFLDGVNIGSSFAPIPGNPLFSQAGINVLQGQHTILNEKGFIAYAYGFGNSQGYGYNTGASVENIQTFFTLNQTTTSIGNPAVDVCRGNAVFDIVTAIENASYTWDFGDGSTPITTPGNVLQQTHNYNTAGTFVVTLTTTLSATNSCQTTESKITLSVLPTEEIAVSITSDKTGTVCKGTVVNFTATASANVQGSTFQWKVNGVNVGTNSNTFSFAPENNDIVSCELTAVNTCSASNTAISNTITAVVSEGNTAAISIVASQNSICANSNIQFTATPANGGTAPLFQWKINGTNVGTNSPTFSSSNLINGDVVSCEMISNATGCISNLNAKSNAITMIVKPNQTVLVSIAASGNSICANTNVQFTATPTNGGTTPAFQWKVNGTNAGTNSNVFSTSSLANGDVVSCEIVSNSTECISNFNASSNTIKMVIVPKQTLSVNISASQKTICANSNVQFTASPINGGANPVFEWRINGVKVGTNSNRFSSSNLANGDVVSCDISINDNNCIANPNASSNQITMVVNKNQPASVTISASQNPICANSTVLFTATAVNGGTNPFFQWNVNGANVGSNSSNFSYKPSDGDLITCTITSNLACTAPAQSPAVTMKVLPLPTITFNPSIVTILQGSSFTMQPVITGNISTFKWSPSVSLNQPNIAAPIANPTKTTTYTLSITDQNSCKANADMKIIVFKDLLMPNGFTPNGDGLNDIFRIPPEFQNLEISYFRVYDRWGQIIFETRNAATGWDGRYKSANQSSAIFVWTIQYKNPLTGNKVLKHGQVALIR